MPTRSVLDPRTPMTKGSIRRILSMNILRPIVALGLCSLASAAVDLRNAVILVPRDAPEPEQKAAQMLTEEIARRTQIRLEVAHSAPAAGRPVIALGTASELGARSAGLPAAATGADGYRVKAGADGVVVAGNDAPRHALRSRLSAAPSPHGAPGGGSGGLAGRFHGAPLSAARPSARLSPQGQHLRWLDAGAIRAVHSRHGGLRHQRRRADPSPLGRCQ